MDRVRIKILFDFVALLQYLCHPMRQSLLRGFLCSRSFCRNLCSSGHRRSHGELNYATAKNPCYTRALVEGNTARRVKQTTFPSKNRAEPSLRHTQRQAEEEEERAMYSSRSTVSPRRSASMTTLESRISPMPAGCALATSEAMRQAMRGSSAASKPDRNMRRVRLFSALVVTHRHRFGCGFYPACIMPIVLSEGLCRPYRALMYVFYLPSTDVLGFLMPPLWALETLISVKMFHVQNLRTRF